MQAILIRLHNKGCNCDTTTADTGYLFITKPRHAAGLCNNVRNNLFFPCMPVILVHNISLAIFINAPCFHYLHRICLARHIGIDLFCPYQYPVFFFIGTVRRYYRMNSINNCFITCPAPFPTGYQAVMGKSGGASGGRGSSHGRARGRRSS